MPWNILSLTFNSGPYDLTGSQLTIGAGGITNNASNSQEIFNNLILSADQTFTNSGSLIIRGALSAGRIGGFRDTDLTVTGTGNTSFRGIVGGNINITKTGTGILYLDNSSGPNTYTGSTSILGGTLNVQLAAIVPGDLIIGNDFGGADATVFTNGNEKIGHDPGDVVLVRRTGALNIFGSETLHQLDVSEGTVDATGTLTVAGNLNIPGQGSHVLGGSVFVGGNVLLNASLVGNTDPGGALTLAGDVTTVPSAFTSYLAGNFRTYNTPAIFNVPDGGAETDLQINGWYFFGGFTKVGTGTMKLTGSQANTFQDDVRVNEGTLVLAKPAGSRAIPGPLTIGDGIGGDSVDVVRLENHNQIGPTEAPDGRNRLMVISSSGMLDLSGFNETLYHVSLSGGVITTGNGTLTLMSGLSGFPVNGLPARVAGFLHFPGGPKAISALNGPLTNDLVLAAGITIAPDAVLTFSGDGQKILTGVAPVTGPAYAIDNGTLLLDKPSTDIAAPSGIHLKGSSVVRLLRPEQIGSGLGSAVRVEGAALLDLAGHAETIRDLIVSGGTVTTGVTTLQVLGKIAYDGAAPSGTAATIAGHVDLGGQDPALFEIGDGPADIDLNIAATLSGPAIRKTGAGTLRLGGISPPGMRSVIEGGRVIIATDQALGGGPITMVGAALQAEASRQLANPITFGGTSSVEGAGSLVLLGPTAISTLEKKGPGALAFNGPQFNNLGSMLHVSGGVVSMNTDSGSAAFPNLAVRVSNAGSRLQLAASQHLASLLVEDGLVVLEPGKVIRTSALAIDASDAKLDLTQSDLIVQASPGSEHARLAELTAAIASARNTAPNLWQGFGLTTSSATPITSLGILLNDRGNGMPYHTTFAGEPVNSDSILVGFTYAGDANLDGRVNIVDYLMADRGAARGLSGWANGDFNYSGMVDGFDFFLMDQAFVMQTGPLDALGAGDIIAVPEPVSGMLLPPLLLALRRRRRD